MEFQLVQTTYFWSNGLAGLINATLTAPLLLAAAKMGLGKAVITPAPSTTYTALSEADFVGYSESATIVWGTPINETDGSLTSISPSHLFRATSAGTPNIINNCFVTDGVAPTATGILASAKIVPGIEITNIGDGFALSIGWNMGPAGANNLVAIQS